MSYAYSKAETARLLYKGYLGNLVFSSSPIPKLPVLKKNRVGGTVIKKHGCIPIDIYNLQELTDINNTEVTTCILIYLIPAK